MPTPRRSERLAGKNIIVTGGGGVLGAAFARHLAAAGASVAVADIDVDAATAVAIDLRNAGFRALAVSVDVVDPESVRAMFDTAEAELGEISVLVNNAGIQLEQPFLEVTEEEWKRSHSVNGKGTLFATQEAARRFIPRGGGKVINTCSSLARQASPDLAAYSASKAATLSVTQSSARALAQHGITVNAIGPGIIDAESAADPAASAQHPQILLGRAAHPDDIAPTAVYLASSDSDYMTGQLLIVDGGIVVQ
ncbi:SDR family NAD(P)-dependent oxidoreductase [Salinibacterium sp. GXW1014]|uniref:SDR family NAD(P)-dependent oxidoreductase n=1 Tax=Salinibacterium sp. GXW1014 TaxID=3377838 RepID=UPI00383AF6B5